MIPRSIALMLRCLPFIILINCQNRSAQVETKNSLNRLALASSPYLREHADNPVDWYQWSPEALEKAENENKPLIISVGYASCHWCHVMERETFMDTAVARIMNENFVSIKIDREERPDIDQIYLNAAQLISGSGGWPLNAFALSDGRPFHAGTYYTKDQWLQMLRQVISSYEKEHENLLKQAKAVTLGIQTSEIISEPVDTSSRSFDQKIYKSTFAKWSAFMDESSGGLKGAPKFPLPVVWEHLLQYQHLTNDNDALNLVTRTLDKMALGGIHDQLGGGFCRYATDEYWKVPHFEKMLYDNAQLISLYAHAYQVTKKPLYSQVVEKTIEFVQRELAAAEGGFYSSINADSENEEGKFYIWTKKEIEKNLDHETARLFTAYYQITDSGNWERGKNILYTDTHEDEFAKKHGKPPEECNKMLSEARQRLLLIRNERVRPSIDDKILLSWNALMLKAYVDAYFAIGNSQYLETALKNARFIEKNMIRENGRLWRNYKDGKPNVDAFLDDYALLAKAFISLYQATFDIHWLEQSRMICEYATEHFHDAHSGMFFYTPDNAENLIARKMELTDNVIPASNSVLAEVMYLLGEYFQDDRYTTISDAMLSQIINQLTTGQPYYAQWATLLGMRTYQPYEVAIVGAASQAKARELLLNYLPTTILMGGNTENLPLLEGKLVKDETIIYVCRDNVCRLPEKDVARALRQFSK